MQSRLKWLAIIPVVLIGTSPLAHPVRHHEVSNATSAAHGSNDEYRGTEEAPLVVKVEQSTTNTETKSASPTTVKPKQWLDGWNLSDKIAAIIGFVGFLQFLALASTIIVMMDNGRKQLRAYLYIEGPHSRVWPPENPDRYSIVIDVVNSGATWARHVTVQRLRITNPPGDPWDAVDWDAVPATSAVFGPQQRDNWQFGDVSAQEMIDIQSGVTTMYFLARVRYRDIFSKKKVRETQLSRQLLVDTEGHHSFTHRATHNCADDDCS